MRFFHRYNSTIHGNYRKAYLRCGVITGVLLILYILVRYMMGLTAESPVSYFSDGIMLLAVFLFTLLYRNALAEKKATLKELMLFGMGTAMVASILYGIFIWMLGFAIPQQTELFTNTLMKEGAFVEFPAHYWSALWGMVSTVFMALLGGFGAFIAALLFRNEKSEMRLRKATMNNVNNIKSK